VLGRKCTELPPDAARALAVIFALEGACVSQRKNNIILNNINNTNNNAMATTATNKNNEGGRFTDSLQLCVESDHFPTEECPS